METRTFKSGDISIDIKSPTSLTNKEIIELLNKLKDSTALHDYPKVIYYWQLFKKGIRKSHLRYYESYDGVIANFDCYRCSADSLIKVLESNGELECGGEIFIIGKTVDEVKSRVIDKLL